MKKLKTLLLASMLTAPGLAAAHGPAAHPKAKTEAVRKEQKDWGIAGDAKRAKRSIAVGMAEIGRAHV